MTLENINSFQDILVKDNPGIVIQSVIISNYKGVFIKLKIFLINFNIILKILINISKSNYFFSIFLF
jgi:hypothetical protein